jgi:hypothetical protein
MGKEKWICSPEAEGRVWGMAVPRLWLSAKLVLGPPGVSTNTPWLSQETPSYRLSSAHPDLKARTWPTPGRPRLWSILTHQGGGAWSWPPGPSVL